MSSSYRFVSRVAVSSEFYQEVDTFDDGDTRSYYANQWLFVGNLLFSVDSAQVVEIFESVRNVEMVEGIYDKTTCRSRGFEKIEEEDHSVGRESILSITRLQYEKSKCDFKRVQVHHDSNHFHSKFKHSTRSLNPIS
ncbi:hypothetical protein RYX36_017112 [Vicia faba]